MQSRYYNPDWGRFINADATEVLGLTKGVLLSHNAFAYCANNPVMGSDPSGYFSIDNNIYLGVGSNMSINTSGHWQWIPFNAGINGSIHLKLTAGFLGLAVATAITKATLVKMIGTWLTRNTWFKEIIYGAIGSTFLAGLVYNRIIKFIVSKLTSVLKLADNAILKIPGADYVVVNTKFYFNIGV